MRILATLLLTCIGVFGFGLWIIGPHHLIGAFLAGMWVGAITSLSVINY